MLKDITNFSLGVKTKNILSQNKSKTEALCKFINFNQVENAKKEKVFIIFAGILGNTEVGYALQFPIFKKYGDVVLCYYSTEKFDSFIFNSQLSDFINSNFCENKDVILVGLSFGALCIIKYLLAEKEAKKIKDVIFFSPGFLGIGFQGKILWLFLQFMIKATFEKKTHFFTQIMKTVFSGDLYWTDRTKIDRHINATKNKALLDRLFYIFKNDFILRNEKIKNIKALFVWFGIDFVYIKNRKEVEELFSNNKVITIKGNHGWLATESKMVNSILDDFLGNQ